MTPKRRKPTASLKSSAAVRYKTIVLNPDGSVASERPFKKNLILDQGLNLHASYTWAQCWQAAALGTGTEPTKRDSASVTMSRAGDVVTASAPYFGSADVGRLLKFDSGEEVYITFYNSSTSVQTADSGTIASDTGTIWYVNQTGLDTEVKRSSTYTVEAGDCETTWDSVDTLTMQRTFLFSVEAAPITYTEVGWSYTTSPGGNLFGRDLIPGGGESLLTGQQLKVVVQMTVQWSPIAQAAIANLGTGGWDTSGTFMFESIAYGVSAVATTGVAGNWVEGGFVQPQLEPSWGPTAGLIFATWSQQVALVSAYLPLSIYNQTTGPTGSGYTDGTFYRDFTSTFSLSNGNGTVYGLQFGSFNNSAGFTIKFTTPQTKDSDHTITTVFRLEWGRTLVN